VSFGGVLVVGISESDGGRTSVIGVVRGDEPDVDRH